MIEESTEMQDTPTPLYNPSAPGFAENPHPQYARLRAAEPVHRNPMGFWMLSRYDDVSDLLRAGLSKEFGYASGPILDAYEAAGLERGSPIVGRGDMLHRDPPDHTRLRRVLSKAFTRRVIQALEPRIQALVDDSLDRLAALGEADLVNEYAYPLPITVITRLLGWPDTTDLTRLRELTGLIVQGFEFTLNKNRIQTIRAAENEMRQLTAEVIGWKRHNRADDMLTALIEAEDDGGSLSETELVAQVALLFIAGHITTVNLISAGTLALLRHPDQLDLLRRRPDLDANAVEELLRYDGPIQGSPRITLQPYTVRDQSIPAGTFVVAALASANRDPDRWGPDTHRLRLERADARDHVAFGSGIHHCLGAPLARLEGRIAIGRLARRFPHLTLTGQPQWNGRPNVRGLTHLPIAVKER